jgi:hypothetical protein
VNVAHLLIGLDIEFTQLLTRGRAKGLLKVTVQSAPATRRLISDLVALVKSLCAICGTSLLVKVAQGACKARGEPVLLVERDSLLDGLIADCVAVREVLGDDARARLVLLLQVVVVLIFGFPGRGAVGACELVDALGGFDVDN